MSKCKLNPTSQNPLLYITSLRFTSRVSVLSQPRHQLCVDAKCAAGLFSSLASHLVAARVIYPRMVSKLVQHGEQGPSGVMQKLSSSLSSAAKSSARSGADAAAPTSTILPSLGASGAIYSTVILSALAFPEAEVSLVFPPTPSFPIQYAVGGFVLLDCIGVLRGWKYVALTIISGIPQTDVATRSADYLTIMRT